EPHRVLAREEVPPIIRDKLRILLSLEFGHRHSQGVVKPDPDDMACAFGGRNGQAHVARAVANALRDRRGGIDDRPVPVEDDQPVLHAAKSEGSGDSSFRRSPLTGCWNESFAACSSNLFFSRLFNAKSPYFSSPTIGW